MKKFLFAWIGTADIEASVHQKTGPIAQALSGNHVDEVVLLTNYPAEKRQNYLNWLETKYSGNISVKYDDFSDPTDYNSVYNHCNRVLGDIKKKQDGECKYIFHLSPGTPTMHAIWVLLGKTIFPADLIQTSEEKRGVEHINIPFDIAAEYVPPLLFNKTDDEIIHLQQSLSPDDPNFNDIVWRSEQMRDVIIMAHRIAVRDLPVLIEGESGTGKELFAQAIHQASNRADKPFVPINCGAIPENLEESELFGYKKGAFTGATKDRKGKIAESSGGTLFLDEIGELSLKSQVKLLRVLQEKKVSPVGSDTEKDVDLRVIAATNRTLQKEVAQGRFREDLFYRIFIGYIYLPPIREREGDIGLLIEHFMKKINQKESETDKDYKYKILSPSAKNFLFNHSWPGNVRELEFTLIRTALIWSNASRIELKDVEKAILRVYSKESSGIFDRPLGGDFSIEKLCVEIRQQYIKRAMKQAKGKKAEASVLLGLKNYQTLTQWIKKYGIDRSLAC